MNEDQFPGASAYLGRVALKKQGIPIKKGTRQQGFCQKNN